MVSTPQNLDRETIGRIMTLAARRGYITIPAAAKILHLHPQTVHSYVDKQWIRHIRVGKLKCITYDELSRYLELGNWDADKALQEEFNLLQDQAHQEEQLIPQTEDTGDYYDD